MAGANARVSIMLLLRELVRVALSKLEYPMKHAHNATGKCNDKS